MAPSQHDIERAFIQDLNRQLEEELNNTEKQLAKTKAIASKLKAVQPNVGWDGPYTMETCWREFEAAMAGGDTKKAIELMRIADAIGYEENVEELGQMEARIALLKKSQEQDNVADEKLSKLSAVCAYVKKCREQYYVAGDRSTEALEAERAHRAEIARLLGVDESELDQAIHSFFKNAQPASSVPR